MANVLETSMNFLQTQDPEIAACIENEFHRQKQNIELIASENIASPAVIAAMGSVLTNKYAEGYPGKRYYGGCDYVDVLENIAMERAKALFGAAYANVQPHSGAQANTTTALATASTRTPAASTTIRSRIWCAATIRSSLWQVRRPIPGRSILRSSPTSRTAAARC